MRLGPFEDYSLAVEVTIDADEWSEPEALTRMITGNYIVGCNTVRVRDREELSVGQLQEIHEAVQRSHRPHESEPRSKIRDD